MSGVRWRYVTHGDGRLYDIGINDDGTLHNPNGYPPEDVRVACEAAAERRHQRRKVAAAKGAETRRRRRDRRVHEVARRIAENNPFGPSTTCVVCKRGLDDPQSIARAVGSECWQDVLERIDERAS